MCCAFVSVMLYDYVRCILPDIIELGREQHKGDVSEYREPPVIILLCVSQHVHIDIISTSDK